LQRDPVTNPLDPHGWAPYAYVSDDPINITDPSGLCAWYHVICKAQHAVHAIVHFYTKHQRAISCSLFALGIASGVGEIAVGAKEASVLVRIARAGGRFGRKRLERVGALGTASGLSFVASLATGGCVG